MHIHLMMLIYKQLVLQKIYILKRDKIDDLLYY
jgi:hypothetical protein